MPVSACPEHLSLLIDRRLGGLWDTLVIQRSTRLLRVAKCRRGGGQRNRLRALWLTQIVLHPRRVYNFWICVVSESTAVMPAR